MWEDQQTRSKNQWHEEPSKCPKKHRSGKSILDWPQVRTLKTKSKHILSSVSWETRLEPTMSHQYRRAIKGTRNLRDLMTTEQIFSVHHSSRRTFFKKWHVAVKILSILICSKAHYNDKTLNLATNWQFTKYGIMLSTYTNIRQTWQILNVAFGSCTTTKLANALSTRALRLHFQKKGKDDLFLLRGTNDVVASLQQSCRYFSLNFASDSS